MRVSFENQSSQPVRLTLRRNTHVLPSGQKAMLELDNQEPICALVDQYKPLRKKDKSYRLVVETEYRLEGLTEGCRILLTRERIALDLETSYDKVFLHPTEGGIMQETYQVVNHPDAKKQLHKNQTSDSIGDSIMWFLLDVLWMILFHPIAAIFSILVSIAIGIYGGWYWIPVILFGILLVACLISMVIDPLIEKLMSKITGIPTQKEKLKEYCTPEALSSFYSQPEREAFLGTPIEH